MKRIVFIVTTSMALFCAILGFEFSKRENLSVLQMANIEALTEAEEIYEQCTRIKRLHNCYRIENGIRVWVATAIDEVEYYYRTSLVEVCTHYQVMPCPSGTSA